MKLKPGVVIHGIRPEMLLALIVGESVWREFDLPELVITSCTDGTHSPTSLHYSGSAVDLRSRDIPSSQVSIVANALSDRLGVDFDVIPEATHIHVEYQPRKPR